MILAAGLTPAWQQVMRFESFHEGEVNRAIETHWLGSGKCLNVAAALHCLGGESCVLAPIGGATGRLLADEFERFGVRGRWIESGVATRVCTTILDELQRRTTELVENAAALSENTLAEFQSAFRDEAARADAVVLSGSLTAGAPATFYRDLLRHSPPVSIVDARGPELWEALAERPLVVKPNREELAGTVGRELETEADVLAAIDRLQERGARLVLVTRGSAPAIFAQEGAAYRLTPAPLDDIVNPIGCGDTLAAALALALKNGEAPLDAACFAMAAARQNAMTLLPGRFDATKDRRLPLVETIG